MSEQPKILDKNSIPISEDKPEYREWTDPRSGAKMKGRVICNRRVVMRTVNWDKLCDKQLESGIGFRITEPGKTDADERPGYHSIHSPLYGSDYDDEKPYENMFSCKCKNLIGKRYADNHEICPICGTPVEFVDLDLRVTGWIILDRDYIMQPEFFKKVENFIGAKRFEAIITYKDPDERVENKSNPFEGIGLIELRERFSEVMDFFLKKNKKKIQAYMFIMSNIEHVWAHCIPVYNKHLRPFYVTATDVKYSKEDRIFKQIFSDHQALNDDFVLAKKQENQEKRKGKDDKPRKGTVDYLRRENIIFHIQQNLDMLWNLSFKSLDKKEGIIQDQILGGRYDYTARNVIVPDASLRQDEIAIGYLTFAEMMKFQIVRYLVELYQISDSKAWEIWSNARYEFNPHVYDIMQMMIKRRDLYVLIGRNPSINYGSAMVCRVVRINPDLMNDNCMMISELILVKPNADFDGDIMYQLVQVVQSYGERLYKDMNPSENFAISKNTGLVDRDMMPKKDLFVGFWAFNNV